MKLIPLSKNGKNRNKYFAIIDDCDFAELSKYSWHVKIGITKTYAYRTSGKSKISMHRQILGLLDSNIFGEHKNGNGLDNRRGNIRVATASENNANKVGAGKSKYLGVSWRAKESRWTAQIQKDGKRKTLGYFKSEEEAARAYDAKAKELHGGFANLNFK